MSDLPLWLRLMLASLAMIAASAFCMAVLIVILAMTGRPAWPHDGAAWIQRGEFKNAIGELCCGPRDLQPLHEIGGSGEQHAPTVLDQCEAEGGREMALAAAGWAEQQDIPLAPDRSKAQERRHARRKSARPKWNAGNLRRR